MLHYLSDYEVNDLWAGSFFDSTSNTANTAIGWYPLVLQDQTLQDFSQHWRHLSREQWRGNKVVQCTAG